MTDPETPDNAATAAHSSGDPDPAVGRDSDSRTGSDVGGPAQTTQSGTEDAVLGGSSSSAGTEDDPDDQAKNPL
jgi:hypothetical protein